MKHKSFLDRVFDFLFPPRCEKCDSLLEEGDVALCPVCRAAWEREKRELCPHCGKTHVFCDCKIDCYRYIHLLPYHKDGFDTVTRTLILNAKKRASRRLLHFESGELASLLSARGLLNCGGYVVSFVPRSRQSKLEYGFDQAELLAKALADKLDFEFASLFTHKGNTKQKTLTADERSVNAEESYCLNSNSAFYARGKRILLLDDVVTTGSSMKACADRLRLAGAREVILLSIARTADSAK